MKRFLSGVRYFHYLILTDTYVSPSVTFKVEQQVCILVFWRLPLGSNTHSCKPHSNDSLPFEQNVLPVKRVLEPLSSAALHSSFVPSAEAEVSLQNSISDLHSTLTAVDDEIHRLRASLASLEGYRTDLHEHLMLRRAVLSPIRRLPAEILGEIFLFAAEGCSMIWPRPNGTKADEDSMPWLLGKICSFWRSVALSLPKLWAEIHLTVKFCPSEHETGSLRRLNAMQDFLQACLARSGTELLTFSLDARGPRENILPVLLALVAHSERWQHVSLDIEQFSSYHTAFAPARNRVCGLRSLHVGTTSMEDTPATDLLDAFENTPSLTKVSISGIVHPFHTLRIPWARVTHFTSKSSTFREGEFTQIMRQTTNLVSFSSEGERILEVASSQPILLPHLEKLSVVNKGSYISKTCQFLTAPNLRELHVHAITPFVAEQTLAMLARSRCTPTHLTFRSSLDVDALWEENLALVWTLNELSSLTYLHLIVLRSADNIMPRLVNRPQMGQAQPLLPNLQEFILEDRFCMSAAEVTEVLSSRIQNFSTGVWGPSSPSSSSPTNQDRPRTAGLKVVRLKLSRPAAPKFPELDLLKQVAENHGVDISIHSA